MARRSALDTTEGEAEVTLPPPEVLEEAARSLAGAAAVQYESAEEALEASGFLADRPPQEHGETGHSFYTVQARQCVL